jgi:hypothetical protein
MAPSRRHDRRAPFKTYKKQWPIKVELTYMHMEILAFMEARRLVAEKVYTHRVNSRQKLPRHDSTDETSACENAGRRTLVPD